MPGICTRLKLPVYDQRKRCAKQKGSAKAVVVKRPAFNAKPEKRSTTKGRKDRTEAQIKKDVRAIVVDRDAGCRLSWLSPCSGLLQWSHLEGHRRGRTRGMSPEQRHTTAGTAMLCDGHHDEYDANKFRIIFETDKGADGPFHVAVTP